MSQHGSRSTCLRADSTTLPAAPSRVKHAVNTNKQKNFGVWRGEEEQELCELCRELLGALPAFPLRTKEHQGLQRTTLTIHRCLANRAL